MTLHTYARSHERRALYYAVITTQENHARLDAIRAAIGKLADPRKLSSDDEAKRLIESTPAVAWLAYSIHGDEMSSTDAAIAVMYFLIACTDKSVADLLSEVVVVIDPLMNPDGRDRIIQQLNTFSGYTPNLDAQAMQHRGRWPRGRGNHYLFDLNRDWILGVHPETRGRQKAVSEWNPQLFVDSHEMGAYDTYLFYPPREPFNPHMSQIFHKWWRVFADDQAKAFDQYGWSYYTREWVEGWYPGYSDSWAGFLGALGILYEQAGVGGSPIRRPAGDILTYREAVHHHAVSSIINLNTLHDNRKAILSDYLQQKRDALAVTPESPAKTFVLRPGRNTTRDAALLDLLHNQGIEIQIASAAFKVQRAVGIFRETSEGVEFPAGSFLIPLKQPLGPLVGATLDFDPHMSVKALEMERKSLEARRGTKIYDVTGWSLPMAYGVDGYWVEGTPAVKTSRYAPSPPAAGPLRRANGAYGHVIDGADDACFRVLAHLLQNGVRVRVAEKEFRLNGREFGRGSLLIRRHENDVQVERKVEQAAQAAGVRIHPVNSGRSPDDGPDLGGGHFILLHRPRVALFGDSPVSSGAFGAVWRLFDVDVGLSLSLINTSDRTRIDLRRYNVVILPPAFGAEKVYGSMRERLKTWVNAGGTLIAIGSAAGPFIKKENGLSAVRRRRDVLPKLSEYAYAVALERIDGKTTLDPQNVWDGVAETQPAEPPGDSPDKDAKAKHLDQWRRVFSPSGVIVRSEVDREHWLTFSMPEELPVFYTGSTVLMSRHPVRTAVRLAEKKRLRLSGLLWPEAAARIADSAYVTTERIGNGQIILFAAEPDFRGSYHGTRRLLINAVLLGPGCGTSQPVPPP